MITVSKNLFGKTQDNKEVYSYTLSNDYIEVIVSEFGANIISIKVPDQNNVLKDIVLGYDNLYDYENQDKYIGATVGRCANRIKSGLIVINNTKFFLNCNDAKNHLHGGNIGFDKKIFESQKTENGVKFSYTSSDREENYPGELTLDVVYTIKDKALNIQYLAKSTKDTDCNITNHTYFNLNGHNSGDILGQYVQIFADYFTPNNEESLPTGEILPVKSTPMDFNTPKQIGQDINSNYEQIKQAKGFDNNWIIKDYDGTIKKAATAFSKETGIKLNVLTDAKGVQFYSGNYLDGASTGKDHSLIKSRYGFCLECQAFPNAFACPEFEKPILKAGDLYSRKIIFDFS